jgi:hypothetical protein
MKSFSKILLSVAVALAAVLGTVSLPAAAFASDWLAARVSQPAFFAMDSKTWRKLESGVSIPAKSWVRTGRTGRVLLQRNGDTIVIQPNSLTGVSSAQNSRRVSVQHRLGQVLLDIDKGTVKRVKVRTHHLTAVVKGTQFSVTTSRGRSTVAVSEGLVGVRDNATGQSADVAAGQSASSSGAGLSSSSASSAGGGGFGASLSGRASGIAASRGIGASSRGERGGNDAGRRSAARSGGNGGSDSEDTGNEGTGNSGIGLGNGGGNGTDNEGGGNGSGSSDHDD